MISHNIGAATTPPYLALSHCWGGAVPIRLEKETLGSWTKNGIAFSSLPKTFRDAVAITRQLGIRYLWVDSLCIVQNSAKDWKNEAALMAEVYGNACCTLAALSSRNSNGGCNIVANIQDSLASPFLELPNGAQRVRIFQRMPRQWISEYMGDPSESPLRTRAWVLQEKELSNCTIYFAKNQLLWENKGARASAQVPWAEIVLEEPTETPRMIYESTSGKFIGAPQHPWYQLVEDYASRSLTVAPDKLVAFSGLAKAYGSGWEAQYLAGIWSRHLPAALLWQVDDGAALRPVYLAPSWSWASLIGAISYDSLRLEAARNSAQYEYPEDMYPGLKSLKVQSAKVILEDEEKPYSTVIDGRITLSGARIIELQCSQESVRFADGGQPLTQHNQVAGVFYPDIAAETVHLEEAYCVALQSESILSLRRHQFRLEQDSSMVSTVMGIVVVRCSKSAYRRVGLARWIAESFFDTVRPMTIEIM